MTLRPVSPSDPLYGEVVEFLYQEAELLDSARFSEWLELLTPDISYRVPVRVNRARGAASDLSDETEFLSENLASLRLRITRLGTGLAWSEMPPSRTRHLVSNIRVRRGERETQEIHVWSYVLVYRNRGWEAGADLLSGEREDVLRRVEDRWRLARRVVCLDQAVLGARDLSIFL